MPKNPTPIFIRDRNGDATTLSDKMIETWGAEATEEIRRAQRQRDEEQTTRLRAERDEQLMRLAFDGLLADIEAIDAEMAARHKAKMLAAGDLAVVPEPIASAAASYEADVARQTASLDAAVVAEDGAVDIAAHHIRDLTALAFAGYSRWPGHVLAIHTDERVLFCEQVQRHAQSVIDRLVAAGIPHAGIAGRVGILRSDYSEEVRRIALGLPLLGC